MNLILFILIGAACGWVASGPLGASKDDGSVGGSIAAGAAGGLVLGLLMSFVFGAIFFLVKIACVIFGVLVLLALLGAGDSD